MSARRQIIAALSEDSYGGIATLSDVENAILLVDAHAAEVLTEAAAPVPTIYANRECTCRETAHPTWCPASIPSDERIAEIRSDSGGPLTSRELSWLKGAAARHELHVTAALDGHWPLTDDLPGSLLLVSRYLAAAAAVIERAGLAEEKAADTSPDFFQPGHAYQREHHGAVVTFKVAAISTSPDGQTTVAHGWRSDPYSGWEPTDSDDMTGWTEVTEEVTS